MTPSPMPYTQGKLKGEWHKERESVQKAALIEKEPGYPGSS